MNRLPRRMFALKSFFLASMLLASSRASAAQDDHTKPFPDYGLTLTLPPQFTDVTNGRGAAEQLKGDWRAKLNGASLTILLYVLPNEDFGFAEPEDVRDIVLDNMREPEGEDPSFGYEKTLLVPGPFGFAAYGAIGYGPIHKKEGTEVTGSMFVFGGLLKNAGYSLEVRTKPALSDADAQIVLDFFKKGIAYKGDARVNKWTDDEAKARWAHEAPKSAQKKFTIYRTEHYIIMTDSSSGDKFGKAMEACYAAIHKVFPFEDVAGHKLMPVFLFLTADEYYDFYSKVHKVSREDAARSKGHAYRDYYATWFEALNDPVHIHEGTHQLFRNRLRLDGGGSWFQEGVAEFMSTKPNDRNVTAGAVKKGKHMPLAEFVKVRSLLYSSKKDDVKGGDQAGDQYSQAAFFIEFLHESKWSKDKFQNAIHAIGDSAPNNAQAIDRAFRAALGTDIAGVEAKWIEYAKSR